MKKLVYISMLGEPSCYNVEDFKKLCSSGLEKDWIIEWHQPLAAEYGFKMSSVDICRGDQLPTPNAVDTVIVGGTNHDIREKFAWLTRLIDWLKEYRNLYRPLLGICGGHQLVSTVFDGGKLVERNGGRLAGTYSVNLSEIGQQHPLFKEIAQNPKFHFGNSLYVLPSDSLSKKVLASVGENPAIAVDHGGHWYSCQFHPESQKKTWECLFKGDVGVDMKLYSEDHDGQAFLKNFFKISRSFLYGTSDFK